MSCKMILLCEIKSHQQLVNSVELRLDIDDIIRDNVAIEVNPDYEIDYILKFPSYGDNNSQCVFYLRSNLDSHFFVQTNVSDRESLRMSKLVFHADCK
jgi:2-hydroxy-3-keto-5-methylthiopentenyl-1-phosphate phosphatase